MHSSRKNTKPAHLLGLHLQKTSHVIRTRPLERLTHFDNSGKLIWVYVLGYIMAIDDIRVNLKNVLKTQSQHGMAVSKSSSDPTCSRARICSGFRSGRTPDVAIDGSCTRGVIMSVGSADTSLIKRRTRTISTWRCGCKKKGEKMGKGGWGWISTRSSGLLARITPSTAWNTNQSTAKFKLGIFEKAYFRSKSAREQLGESKLKHRKPSLFQRL